MNPIEKLKKEHEDIERELLELDEIIKAEEINYPNLVHVLRNLHELWNCHELREERIFKIFEKERIKIPVEKMLFEHEALRPHLEKIKKALNSSNELETKISLHTDAIIIIEKLRKHIAFEDEVLYTIAEGEFTPAEIKEMEKYI